jgi:hypothetical protein
MAFGIELATAYVHVVPSFSGVNAAMASGFAPAGAIADKAGAEAGKNFGSSFGSTLKKAAGTFGIVLGVKALVDGFNGAVDAASHLKEATAAADVVFGDSFTTIEKWAKSASGAFGQSNTQALQAAKTFGIFGQSAGLAGEENAKFSIKLAELASDLASFNDTSPEEAIIALGAALRGENEPIRRFGVLLDDATLRNKALQLGLITTTKDALTPQQKVLAAYAAIMEQTSIQQGDFARTSEGFANQQRTLQSQWEDISAAIGDLFLPIMEDVQRGIIDNVIPALEDLVDWLGKLDDEEWFQQITSFFDQMKAGGELDLVSGGFVDTFKKRFGEELPGSFEHGWEQIKTANAQASEDLPKAFEDSWNTRWVPAATHGWEQITTAFGNGWTQIQSADDTASTAISDWWNTFWGVQIPEAAGHGWEQITGAFANGWTQITDAFGNGWTQITDAFANGWGQVTTWWNQLWTDLDTAVSNGWNQITGWVGSLWTNITTAFSNGWNQITTWWTTMWTDLWTTVSTWTQTIWTTFTTWVGDLVQGFIHGWDQITDFFSGAAKTIKDIIDGVLKTMRDCAQGIRDAFDGIGQFIRDAFGPIGDFIGGVASTFANLFGGIGDRGREFRGKLSALAATRKSSGFSGGVALQRVLSVLGRFPGLHITETLGNRAYDVANGVDRSPNSYHYDANNPAVDIAGPIPQLYALADLLYAMGGWRQILWQVPGHYDHIHVAHSGGMVESNWPRMWGDKWDERTARLQVGEYVMPRGWEPPRAHVWDAYKHHDHHDHDRRERVPAVAINGDVYTTDIDEFFDEAERMRRRAEIVAAPVTS